MPWPSRKRDKGAVADKKEPDAKIAKTEEETLDKEEEEKSAKPPAGSSKSGWKNWKKKESESGGEESKITYCHWLLKSEPESRLEKGVDVKFSVDDLKAQPNQTTCWDGVRNYQARNFLRSMKLGQQAFFYHSNCKEPGIVALVKIVKEAYPDHTQFDQKDPHYDSTSRKENPKWSMVDVQFVRMTKRFIPLSEIKAHHLAHKADGGPLKDMMLFTRQRLSIQPLTQGENLPGLLIPSVRHAGSFIDGFSFLTTEEFDFVLSLEEEKPH
ncbi:THYN1 protein, partial [Vidua chalybeata]|nr:THYN1 protein [Vidua chalybeata]